MVSIPTANKLIRQMDKCATSEDVKDWLALYIPINSNVASNLTAPKLMDDFCEDCDLPHRKLMAEQGRCRKESGNKATKRA